MAIIRSVDRLSLLVDNLYTLDTTSADVSVVKRIVNLNFDWTLGKESPYLLTPVLGIFFSSFHSGLHILRLGAELQTFCKVGNGKPQFYDFN